MPVTDPWLVQYIDDGDLCCFEVDTYEEATWWSEFLVNRWHVPVNIVRRSLRQIIGDEWAERLAGLAKESAS